MKETKISRHIIGDSTFRAIWEAWNVEKGDEKGACDKLKVLLKLADMSELTGSPLQTEYITEQFEETLAPHDKFWGELAALVQIAFPYGLVDSSVKDVELARMVHQFRYVIDAWQVRYIRENYSGIQEDGDTFNDSDEGKLVQYFRELRKETSGERAGKWSLEESDRLHQKYCVDEGDIIFPAGAFGVNMKITYNFHTEFIIQNGDAGRGSFAYILDNAENNQNSILNGASFNYADANDYHAKQGNELSHKESRHYNLDIETGAVFDPEFRKKTNIYYTDAGDKKFSSPTKAVYLSEFKRKSDINKDLFKMLAHKY